MPQGKETWGHGIIKDDDGIPKGIVVFPNSEIDMHELGNTECRCKPKFEMELERGAYELVHRKLIGKINPI
jgi:hypothetical protein